MGAGDLAIGEGGADKSLAAVLGGLSVVNGILRTAEHKPEHLGGEVELWGNSWWPRGSPYLLRIPIPIPIPVPAAGNPEIRCTKHQGLRL